MYYAPKEHNPPHIHAYYQDVTATFDINQIEAWIEIHKEDLIANWELCQNGEEPFEIEPHN